MAPAGGGKRKRGDRNYSFDSRDDNSRPSPHRPGSLSLGQHTSPQQSPQQQNFNRDQYDQRGGGRRRGSRGGRGGGSQRSPINSPNAIHIQPRPNTTPQPSNINNMNLQTPKPTEAVQADSQSPSNSQIIATQTQEKTPSEPPPYAYEYVTDSQHRAWAETGRAEVIAAGRQACEDKDQATLYLLFQDLIRAGLDSRIEGTDAGSVVREIVETFGGQESVSRTSQGFQPDKVFLDILSICSEAWNVSTSLKPIVFATNISAQLMRLILDSSLLENLGLIRSTFVRVGIRQQTNVLYRQSNYNLLREETEGYSKLVTELFTTSSGEALSSEVVEETFERVKGMIGAFDLDVGRVLDVTLDVFAAVLVKQYRFFVKYLRVSSWWPLDPSSDIRAAHGLGTLPKWALPGEAGRPMSDDEKVLLATARDERDEDFWQRVKEIGINAFFEIGNRKAASDELKQALESAATVDSVEAGEDQAWMETTGTLPPVGNKVAAQILGFKLRFYSSSARDASDQLPLNIIYLAALLIKIGFISLRDLYPHLWPSDDAMDGIKEAKTKENSEKERLSRPGASAQNALLMAGALTDERVRKRDLPTAAKAEVDGGDTSTNTTEEKEKDELPEPAEQKIQLLKSLLCIGAIPESLYMLGRFPWLIEAFSELPEHLHRILHHCLNKVYEPLRPLNERSDLREQPRLLDGEQSVGDKGQLRFVDAPPRKVMRWAQIDRDDTNEGIDYKFYWDDWADSVPVCRTIDDVFLLGSTLLNFTGVKIGQDSALLVKLCRIGRHSLQHDRSDANKKRWIDLCKRILVPALSLTKSNPGVANEIFELIQEFTLHTRYSFYAEWFQGQTSRLPEIKAALDRARSETRDVLKRISKSNLKSMARALAKIAYSSPGAVFQLAISQIEIYENFAETFTECARYLTYLAYDVFNWALLSAVGGGGKSRVQADGMLTSHWLQSLTVFISKVYKRYPVMSPVPMLQYVLDQLTRGNSVDLIVLEEVVTTMAGIISDTNFNDNQVVAMGGGEQLQAQTMLQLLDRRHELKPTARRLMKCLAEPKLAGQLLVAIAQERENCVYNLPDKDAPAKLLGNLFDEVHRVLTQYLDFMRTNLSVVEFDSLVPGVSDLILEYGVQPGVAFWISRTSVSAAMAEYDAQHPNNPSSIKLSPVKELVEAESLKAVSQLSGTGQAAQDSTSTSDDSHKLEVEKPPVDMKDIEQGSTSNPASSSPDSDQSRIQQLWHPVLREIMDRLSRALPSEMWEGVSPSFFVTFWQLSLCDLQVPAKSYQHEQDRLKAKVDNINKDRTDVSMAGTQRKERDKKLILDLVDRLASEHKERVNAYQRTRVQLGKEKTVWFADFWGRSDECSDALIEQCFFPRIRMSSVDALYAFKMYQYLHSSATTNFRTLKFLDRMFMEKRLENVFFLCSAKEAEHLGRFLREVLKDLARWHANKATYEREAFGTKKELKGFCVKVSKDGSNDVYMDFEDFRRIFNKWHRNINAALKTCFSSGEYMHIRNAINISKAIVEQFPAVNWMGNAQAACIERLSKTEVNRPDLQLAAASLLGNIRRREKAWVLPQAFALSQNENPTNGAGIARPTSAKPSTPQPEPEASKPLNPKTSPFEPSARATVNNASKPGRPGDVDAQDGEEGEIEDAKMADATPIAPTTVSAAQTGSDIAKSPLPAPVTTNGSIQQAPANAVIPTNPMVSSKSTSTPAFSQQSSVSAKRPSHPEGAVPSPPNNQAPASSRPEAGRTSSSNPINGRLQHTLPDRPEAPITRPASHRMSDRFGERTPRDTGNDQRFPSGPGDDYRSRPSDRETAAQQPRGHDPSHGRAQLPAPDLRSRPDSNDRYGGPVRPDARPYENLHPREKHASENRPLPDSNVPDIASRNSTMPPPRSNLPHHPDRAALIHGNRNPDRPPLNNLASDRRSDFPRYDGYTTPDRSSRGASPARSDDRRQLRNDSRRDVRHDDRPLPTDGRNFSDHTYGPSRRDEGNPPAGPRTDRPSNYGQSGPGDRFQESMKSSMNSKPTVDLNHGRLNQDSPYSGQRSEQYGRLNSGSEVPSGPRLPNGNHAPLRNSRNVSAPQPQLGTQTMSINSQNAPPQSPTMGRQTPTGPSSDRAPSQNIAPNARHHPANTTTPPTPVQDPPDTAGIHPDRLKALAGLSNTTPPPIVAANNPNSIQIQGNMGRPPPRPQQQQQQQQQPPSLPPVAVPRGPSNQQIPPSPTGPSPTNRGPPTGPGRSDKRFAGIQEVLQQANNVPNGPDRNGQGASIRGRGGRPNNTNTHSPSNSEQPTPSMPQRSEQFQQRADLFAGRNGGSAAPQQQPIDDVSAYDRNGRRGPPRGAGGEREDLRDARENHRGSTRDGSRANIDPVDGDRRSSQHQGKAYPPRSSSRRDDYDYDARQPQPPSQQPPRRDEESSGGMRNLRSDRGGPAIQPPPGNDLIIARDSYRGARGGEADMPPRDRRSGPPDRRDSSDWGRGDRDRRDGGSGGRKRGRPTGDEAMVMGGSAEKRPRRGP